MKLLSRQWELLYHCNACPVIHTKPKRYPFSTGKERNTWSRRAKVMGRFSLSCSAIVWLLLQPDGKSSVSEAWPFQGLHFRGSFHCQPESRSHIRSQAALFFLTSHFKFSGSPLHVPNRVSEHIPEQLNSGFIYRFYWHCCHSKCCPADKEPEKSPASISKPETCATSVVLLLPNLVSLTKLISAALGKYSSIYNFSFILYNQRSITT